MAKKKPHPSKGKPRPDRPKVVKAKKASTPDRVTTSIYVRQDVHEFWMRECQIDRRSFSSIVDILLTREMSRILAYRGKRPPNPADASPTELWLLTSASQPAAPLTQR